MALHYTNISIPSNAPEVIARDSEIQYVFLGVGGGNNAGNVNVMDLFTMDLCLHETVIWRRIGNKLSTEQVMS